jgi:hypothetical protein
MMVNGYSPLPLKTPLLNLPVAAAVFLATVIDGDVSRRFDNACDSETAVLVRSMAFPLTVVVAVVSNGTALAPVPRYVESVDESKTFLVVVLFFLTSSSSSLNNKPAERDVRCCVLCRLKS